MSSSFLKGQDQLATTKQVEYIEQLAIDLGFDRTRRNAHINAIITDRTGRARSIDGVADLSKNEASFVIKQFLTWKLQPGIAPR